MITEENLMDIFQHRNNHKLAIFVEPVNKTIEDYGINNPAMFIAQIGVESGGFRELEENLNYTASQLMRIFPRYFQDKDPNDYAHQPEKIANLIYANRMGNGDETSGDGYLYRGRGAIQVTGTYSYEKFAQSVEKTLEEVVEYTKTEEGAIMSAGWFWDANHINTISDDVEKVSRRINGGDIGLSQRIAMYARAQEVIGS